MATLPKRAGVPLVDVQYARFPAVSPVEVATFPEPPDPEIVKSPEPRTEFPFIVFILVPDTRVSCLPFKAF